MASDRIAASDAPRIPPLPPGKWPKSMRAALAPLQPENPKHPRPLTEGRPKGLNVLGTFAQHPELAHAFMTFNAHVLFTSTITVRQRELLVLRVAAVRGATYEWEQHAVIAGDNGISDDEVALVAEGPAAGAWSRVERALLRAVDELVAHATITDGTWAELATELDEQQLLDVVFTVGAYDVLAMALNVCRTPLDDDLKRS